MLQSIEDKQRLLPFLSLVAGLPKQLLQLGIVRVFCQQLLHYIELWRRLAVPVLGRPSGLNRTVLDNHHPPLAAGKVCTFACPCRPRRQGPVPEMPVHQHHRARRAAELERA